MSYVLALLNAAALVGAVAALQALLLNRLRLAFAAMAAFAGLGAFVVAVGGSAGVGLLGVAIVLVALFAWLAERLPRDEFLLATLAVLATLGAVVSATPALGGRTGLAPMDVQVGGEGFEERMAPLTLGVLVLVVAGLRLLLSSSLGIAIDRIGEGEKAVAPFLPIGRFRAVVLATTSLCAMSIGALTVMYRGRVGPDVFSIDSAVHLLTFTVVAGRRPELAALVALVDAVFPFFASRVLPLSMRGAEELERIVWGAIVVAMAVWPTFRSPARVGS